MMVGKWHLGVAEGHRPWEQGFERSYGALAGALHPWQHAYRSGPLEASERTAPGRDRRTCAAIVGAGAPAEARWDGQDLTPLLRGEHPSSDRVLYWKYGGGMGALLKGSRKLVVRGDTPFARRQMPGGAGAEDPDRRDQLFDLLADPAERFDLAERHPDEVASLRAVMAAEAAKDRLGRLYPPGHPNHWDPRADVHASPRGAYMPSDHATPP